MKQNWILTEAKKADEGKDLVILENPAVKSRIDGLLLNRFWPVIQDKLRETHYAYLPDKSPELNTSLSDKLHVNVALYELSKEGFISEEKVGDFITTAYKAYEAF